MPIFRTMSGLITFTKTLSQLFLTISPLILLIGIKRIPRTALYVASETLVLLSIVYTFRNYIGLSDLFFSFHHALEKLYLITLYYVTFLVITIHRKAVLPKIQLLSTPSAEAPINLDTTSADSTQVKDEEDDSVSQRRVHKFNWPQFKWMLISTLPTTLYAGERSLISRIPNYFQGKPNNPFWSDFYYQLLFPITISEVNAVVFQLVRVGILRIAERSTNTVEGEGEGGRYTVGGNTFSGGVTGEELKQRMKTPSCVWGWLWTMQVSAALLIPSCVSTIMGKEGVEDVDMFRAVLRLISCSMQVVIFAGFLVIYKWVKPKKRVTAAVEEEGDGLSL